MKIELVPAFLAAPPHLSDPHFGESVVAMSTHEKEGTMGFIINQHAQASFHELLIDLSIEPKIKDKPVLFGGPISRTSGFVLYEHAGEKPFENSVSLAKDISLSPSREVLEMAAAGKLPGRFELILGYAGWGPGQLDQELSQGGWLLTPVYEHLFFDVPLEKRWAQIYEKIGVSPLGFVNVPGGAQA